MTTHKKDELGFCIHDLAAQTASVMFFFVEFSVLYVTISFSYWRRVINNNQYFQTRIIFLNEHIFIKATSRK